MKIMSNSERIKKLFSRTRSSSKTSLKHMIVSEKEQKSYADIIQNSYLKTKKRPAIARKSAFLVDFAEKIPIRPLKNEWIIGSARFNRPRWSDYFSKEEWDDIGFSGNMGHIIVDYCHFLRNGIAGMKQMINKMPTGIKRNAFMESLDAFSFFIKRHANACKVYQEFSELSMICERISVNPPETFHEAIQLLWFIQIFLHAESSAVAFSFGRFDQFMFPFLEKDLKKGILTEEKAKELISCFFIKCCEGDESQNLILGGTDEVGRLAENKLSFLCLEVMKELKVWQPSLSVRFSQASSEKFINKSLELCLKGTGMPSFFNDDAVIASLQNAGIPEFRARDYGIVGCYEPSPQGDAYPLTVAGGINLPQTLLDFLEKGSRCRDFESFIRGYKIFFKDYYKVKNKEFQTIWNRMAQESPSPFESICVRGCIESGLAAEEGGARFNMFGVNLLGIGTLIDSLASVKKIVFEEKALTLSEFVTQIKSNFPDENICNICKTRPEKFGTDQKSTNQMARNLSDFFADTVLKSPLEKAQTCPGFFWFGQDINIKMPATPDGRKQDERVSYGVGPSEHDKKLSPTSILKSAANIAHNKAACGTALILSFRANDIDIKRLYSLIKVYFKKGGFHLHANITDAKVLQNAQKNPDKHSDIIIRISGYSARFSTLTKEWQDAIIARTEKGT